MKTVQIEISQELLAKIQKLAKTKSHYDEFDEWCEENGSEIEFDEWIENEACGSVTDAYEMGVSEAEIELAREILKGIKL